MFSPDDFRALGISLVGILLVVLIVATNRMKRQRDDEVKKLILRWLGLSDLSFIDIEDKLMDISHLHVYRRQLIRLLNQLVESGKIMTRGGVLSSRREAGGLSANDVVIISLTEEARAEFKAGMYNRYSERPKVE